VSAAIGHEVIRASAGAGKTYQLVTRYVGLLAAGVPPEEIVALTFSRKAAGEILDKIVERLADSSDVEGSDALAALNMALGESGYRTPLERVEVLGMLRRLLARLHLCRVGTLDGFFVGIVRAFPLELGLSGDLRIIDGYAARLARQEVLGNILAGPERGPRRAALLEGFKQANYGQERKGIAQILDEFVTALHEVFLEAPAPELWGVAESIWRGPDPWAFGEGVDPAVEADALREYLQTLDLPDKVMARWDAFFAEICTLNRGDAPPVRGPLHYMLEKLGAVADDLRRGQAEVKIERTVIPFDGDAAARAWRLLGRVQWAALAGAREKTRGLWSLLDAYETEYDATVRRSGRLGFRDVMHLLAPADGRFGSDAIAREYVAYRMDGTFSHWLLDEFQDTSTLQWRALRDLVDEVLQDPERRRTLFYVGDVKQAIYNWRGGNATLFQRILDHYSPDGDRIRERPLFLSWRSAPPVIDTVNHVFGSLAPEMGIPAATLDAWAREWGTHDTARREVAGYVAHYEIPRVGNAEAGRESRASLVAALLAADAPHRRGLSVAVLVRNNRAGEALAEHLRAAGLPAAWEGDASVSDNPLAATLLSLVRVADHPSDSFAWEHLRMGPLWPVIEAATDGQPTALVTRLLARIHGEGFEALIREWTVAWDRVAPLDSYLIAQAEVLAGAAREVDAAGETRCLEFIDFVRAHRHRPPPAAGAIAVLTMHRAKGLQWDHVILPDLQAPRGRNMWPDLLVNRAPDLERTPRWVLNRPPGAVCVADSVLRGHQEATAAEEWYEQLCLLYVAMTRAKRGLDIITTAPTKNSRAVNLASILRAALASEAVGTEEASVLFRTGDPDWISALPTVEPPPPALPTVPRKLRDGGVSRRRTTRTPSGTAAHGDDGVALFAEGRKEATSRGTAIHELFEAIEWLDQAAPEEIAKDWRRRHPTGPVAAEDEFLEALNRPAVRAALTPPDGPAVVWREQRFELVLDEDWVSGAFDRVVFIPDADNPTSARVIDFKTDRVSGAALDERVAAYRPQMKIYRQALAALTGLDPSAITWTLLFTRPGVTRSGP